MTRERRSFTDEQRSDAISRSLVVGVTQAGKELDIPHQSIAEWRRLPRFRYLLAQDAQHIERRLSEAFDLAIGKVIEGLNDPKSNLGHRARALETLRDSLALMRGEATERTETANLNIGFNASWQPPPGAEPILTREEQALLERYLGVLESGTAVVTIDADYRQLEAGEDDDVG